MAADREWPPGPTASPEEQLDAIVAWAMHRASPSTKAWLLPAAVNVGEAISDPLDVRSL